MTKKMYTAEEETLINQAFQQGGDVWNNVTLTSIKRKIKSYYRNLNSEQCCYCRRDLQDEFNLVIDIEHILPKGKEQFRNLMFEIENLNISCKRCNMNIKNDNTDFIVDINNILPDFKHSNKYHIIHPNFDNYFHNIDYEATIRNNKKLIKYVPKTNKGQYTYKYFKLDKIEIDTLSIAQGVNIEDNSNLSNLIDNDSRNTFEELIKRI